MHKHSRSLLLGAVALGMLSVPQLTQAVTAATVSSPFYYTFNVAGTLDEAGSIGDSTSPYWWLNSGGQLPIKDGKGSTMQGDAPATNKWRKLYANNNPMDTDNGLHPQNLFRLVSRSASWDNVRLESYFTIVKDNLSSSSNRNASNGLLLMSRYQTGATLYYAGVRVDGKAIIKKKLNGTYYTLASNTVFPGTYNTATNPNLIPKNTPIGLRSETVNNADGSVTVRLYMDQGKTGAWKLIAEAKDTGAGTGSTAITGKGSVGIRTDFMDVLFTPFVARSL